MWFALKLLAVGGDGSVRRPWDLATALAGAPGRIRAGDTVWLRGGTYRVRYVRRDTRRELNAFLITKR